MIFILFCILTPDIPILLTEEMVSPEDEMRKMLTEKDDCIKSLEIIIKNKNIIIQKLRTRLCRLNSKYKEGEKENKENRHKTNKEINIFTGKQLEFINMQFKRAGKSVKGNRFSENYKMFALSLWHCSPKCYRLLQKIFTLPGESTLRLCIKSINMQPGYHKCIIDSFKDKCCHLKSIDKLVVIAFDEMSLKTSLEYDCKTDNVKGFEDLGDGERTNVVASYVTVFMIKSIFGSWKQPVGYFVTSGVMTADVISSKLYKCIDICFDCGLIPKVIICDQGPSNRGCFKKLNISIGRPYINYKGNDIFFMYDPPHLLKSIRNNLKNGYIFNGNKVSMKNIETFYEEKIKFNLQLAPKLQKKTYGAYHIYKNES